MRSTQVTVKLTHNTDMVTCEACAIQVKQRDAVGVGYNDGPKRWYCAPCVIDGKMDGHFEGVGKMLRSILQDGDDDA
jgi:hypothetical protein